MYAEFARRIGVTNESVRRYAHGQRFPRPEIMRRIMAATDGAVGPNDFLDAVSAPKDSHPAEAGA